MPIRPMKPITYSPGLGGFSRVLALLLAAVLPLLVSCASLLLEASTSGAVPPLPSASASITSSGWPKYAPSLRGRAGEGLVAGEGLLMSGVGLGSTMTRIRAVPVLGVPPALLRLTP